MNKDRRKIYIAAILSILYIIVGVLTLKDYGISWDEPTHFKRGQAYLQYFLTGKKTYEGLKPYPLEEARKNPGYHERSFYQNDAQNGNYYLKEDGGHPPLNGIISAGFNKLFYQKIPLLGDVESYHLFEVVMAGVAVGAVFIFGWLAVSFWTGLFSAVFLATYPLFWAESHFNIKDPVETTFFTLTIFGLWLAFKKTSYKWILGSALFAGFALGTKFNILFLPFIILPWLIVRYLRKKGELLRMLKNKKFLFGLVIFPLIMFLIFFASWPYLWHNTIARTLSVVAYYTEIGTEADLVQQITSERWNFYALKWIVASTPPIILFFTLAGIIFTRKWITRENNFVILWLLWLIIPILRVSFPGASIYGGVRQLMEYVPALALVAGLGAESIRLVLVKRSKIFSYLLLFPISLAVIFPLAKTHPNENVYFNSIFGGLPTMMSSGFPAAGNSFGNAYKQGLDWVIKNAPNGSKLALIQGTSLNIPLYKVPPKINFSNSYFSGIERGGEYLMEVTYNAEVRVYFYDWEYVEKFLKPVHEIRVDGVPILKIWKNDLDNTYSELRLREKPYNGEFEIITDENTLTIKFPQELALGRLVVNYNREVGCKVVENGFVESLVEDQSWIKERDPLSISQMPTIKPVTDKAITYFFAARKTKGVRLSLEEGSCALLNPQVSLMTLN